LKSQLSSFNFSIHTATLKPTSKPTSEPCANSYFSKPPLNIGIVIDTSYSTYELYFDGKSVGDVNGDGKSNTILDAEIAAVFGLLNVILTSDDLNNGNVDIGLILFDTEGVYKGHYAPLNDSNTALNTKLVNDLKAIRTLKSTGDVVLKNIGFTNFDDALDKSILYFSDPSVPSDRTNLMVFMSDGKPNVRGDGDNEPWCVVKGVNCAQAPANKAVTASTPKWDAGQLSYCFSGDTSCNSNGYANCARGVGSCEEKEPAMTYNSELAELDRLKVNRLAIGVGGLSYTAKGSALWRIDSSPRKDIVTPPQVFTTDDLITAMRNLCPATTAQPTSSPSKGAVQAPTRAPTTTPEDSICSEDVELIKSIGSIPYNKYSPIHVISQDRSTVTFEIKNTFSTSQVPYVYTQYDGLDSSAECLVNKNVTGSWSSESVTAVCMTHLPVALVHIWVSAPSSDLKLSSVKVPACCYSPVEDKYPKIQLTFMVNCESQCLDE